MNTTTKHVSQVNLTTEEWSLNDALQSGISLEESRREMTEMIYRHFEKRKACA